jgi:hypothetical protein
MVYWLVLLLTPLQTLKGNPQAVGVTAKRGRAQKKTFLDAEGAQKGEPISVAAISLFPCQFEKVIKRPCSVQN